MMRPLTDSSLLWTWEWGMHRHPLDRALLILSAACPEQTAEERTLLTIGQRDAYLLDARAATFGDRLDSLASCPECRNELQFTLRISNLRDASQPIDAQAPFTVERDGMRLQLRCLNSLDLADAVRMGNTESANRHLLQRCVVDARRGDQPVPAGDLPAHLANYVAEQVAKRDPQADIQVDLTCPECAHQWQLTFDIATYFWNEIACRARQLLQEVYTLARAFCWPEADILAMSSTRREAYLQMVG